MSKKEIRWDDSDSDSEDDYMPKASSFAPRSSMNDSSSEDDNENVNNHGSGYSGKYGGGNRAPPPPQRNDFRSGPSQHDYQMHQRPMGGGGRGGGQYHSGGGGRGGGGRGRGRGRGGSGPMDYRDKHSQRQQQPQIDWKEQARQETMNKYKNVDLNSHNWMQQRKEKEKKREMQQKKEAEERRQKMTELKKEEREAKRKLQQASLFGEAKPVSGIIQRPPPSPPVDKDKDAGEQSKKYHTVSTNPMPAADGMAANRSESTVTPTVSKAVGSSKPVSSLSSGLSGLRIGSSNISPSSAQGSSRPRLKLAPRTKPVPKLEVDPHYLQNTKKKNEKKKNTGENDNDGGDECDANPSKRHENQESEKKPTEDVDISKPSIDVDVIEVKQQQAEPRPVEDEVENKDDQEEQAQAQDASNTDKKEEPRSIEVNNDTRQMSEIPTENSALSATSNREVGDGSETASLLLPDAKPHPTSESVIQKKDKSTASDSKRGTGGKRNEKDTGRGRGRGGKRFHGGRRGGGRFHSNRNSSGKYPKRVGASDSSDKHGDASTSKSSLAIASNIDVTNVKAKVGTNAQKVTNEVKPPLKDNGDSSTSSKNLSGTNVHGDYQGRGGRGGRGRGRGSGGRGRGNWRGGRGRGRGRGGRGRHGQNHNDSSGSSNKDGGSGGNQS